MRSLTLSRLCEDSPAALAMAGPGTKGFCPFNLLRRLLNKLFAELVWTSGGLEAVSSMSGRFSTSESRLDLSSPYATRFIS